MSDINKDCSFHEIIKDYRNLQHLRNKIVYNETIVSTVCDKLNFKECEILIKHVKFNYSLVSIVLRNKMVHEIVTNVVSMEEAKKFIGTVFYTSFIIETFMRILSNLIFHSDNLKHIVFIKIPPTFGLSQFCSAIRHNRSLTILHIEDSDLKDEGCIQICQALRRCPITSLALINCKITSSGMQWISWLLKEQSMLRKMARWRKTNNDLLHDQKLYGIRKLNLNDNIKIEDNGAKFLFSTLFEDSWVKHVHLQNIGLTENSCMEILRLLKHNHELSVFDIERNSIESPNLLSFINVCLNSRNNKCLQKVSECNNMKDVESLLNVSKYTNSKINLNSLIPIDSTQYKQKSVDENMLHLLQCSSYFSNNNEEFPFFDEYENKKEKVLNGNEGLHNQDSKKKNKKNYRLSRIENKNSTFKNLSSEDSAGLRRLRSIDKIDPLIYKIIHNDNSEVLKIPTGMKLAPGSKSPSQLKTISSRHTQRIGNARKGKENKLDDKMAKSSSTKNINSKPFNKVKYITNVNVESYSSNWISQLANCDINKKYLRDSLKVANINDLRSKKNLPVP